MDDSLIFSHLRAVCEQHGLRWCEIAWRDGSPHVLLMRAVDGQVSIDRDLARAVAAMPTLKTTRDKLAAKAREMEAELASARAELQRLENLPTSP